MLFQAQNGVGGDETRKNDNKGIITAAASQKYETAVSIHPHHQSGPTKMSQQHVKLTVLPLFVKNDQGHKNYNNMDVNLYRPSNYNGVLETAPSSQTIEESVATAAHANEANAITSSAQKVPKKKRKPVMKNYVSIKLS